MQLFLTSVLPFLAHDHASAAAFLTCRHHNFHASIIPEFLSDEERVKSFCEARQQHELEADVEKEHRHLYKLFARTPLMQFSPTLLLRQWGCAASILKSLIATKYFTRSLQRCSLFYFYAPVANNLLQALSKGRSLTKLDFGDSVVENEHFEIIINSFPSLETLTIYDSHRLDSTAAFNVSSPPPPVTKTLRSLTMIKVCGFFSTQFVAHFSNLRKLALRARNLFQKLDLLRLSSSLPLLTDLSLECYTLENIESLNNLVHLSTLQFRRCHLDDSLSFLTKENRLPQLTTLCIDFCEGLSTSSFASLDKAPNLHVLNLCFSKFNNDCFQYLEKMVHVRKLDLSSNDIIGDSRSLKTLMQNLFQLEELNLSTCGIGSQGAIAGALYSTHSRLRVLNLSRCNLVDDDLNGIGALKNTLEVLELSNNPKLTSEGLKHCTDLMKLKKLNLRGCTGINDLSPLKDCLNLEELNVGYCRGLTDVSFNVFSEEPNSFPNLQLLNLSSCLRLTGKVFEHLSKNNHLVYRLKELKVGVMSEILAASPTARNNVCQLKRLRRLYGSWDGTSKEKYTELMSELARRLKSLDEIK